MEIYKTGKEAVRRGTKAYYEKCGFQENGKNSLEETIMVQSQKAEDLGMKKHIAAASIVLIFLFCSGCSMQTESNISEGQVTEEPDVTEKSEVTEEPEVKEESEMPEETDRLAGYGELYDYEEVELEGTFVIIGEISREVPPDPYEDINEDGSIDLFLDVAGGTPYAIAGAVYDHEMFSLKAYGKVEGADADGGGNATALLCFTPQCAGETEILMLIYYFGHEIYEGTIYHITVGEDLRCQLDWYGYVSEEENLELHLKENIFE